MNDILVQKKNSPAEKAKKLVELQVIIKNAKVEADALKADLLEIMQSQDVLTLKTGSYTLSRAHKVTPQVVDFKLLKQSLDKADIPYMVEEVFTDQMKIVFKQAIEEGRELDGLESLTTEYVSIRVKEPKRGEDI
jgi:hypothetical protein